MTELSIAPPSLARDVVGRVGRQWGTRLGVAWIAILVFLAVFAPFIATSYPLLEESGGHWSSPVLHSLSCADVTLQIGFWAAVILVPFHIRLAKKAAIWLGILAIVWAVAAVFVHAPELVVYEQFRQAQAAGQIQHAVFAPIPYSPLDHLRDFDDMRLQPPDATHWMGTTQDSADLLSNMVHATRIALSIGFISTGIAMLIGVVLGGLMGYFVGWLDLIGMRIAEVFDSVPTLLLLLCFTAFFGRNLYIMMAIIGVTNWVTYAYYLRAEFLSLRDRDFVHAARAAGIPLHSIIFRHMLLNGLTPIIVTASFGVASAILYESTLSFLGIGLTDESSWGALLEEALSVGGSFSWWIALYPGLAIFLTVFAYNLIGESLRDALDPRMGRMM
ncbi:MAG TPA: ABC transporter permease [Tepidisphaeraceae bacterium]|nr:ABC transporter permease [Tepidisphaeraceae bacterium]